VTVIAWDGTTLAADKQGTNAGLRQTVTKLFRLDDGAVGIEGDMQLGLELLHWLRGSRDPDTFPASCRGDDAPAAFGVVGGAVCRWLGSPFPLILEDPFTANGSGRDYAIAAMHCGKTAKEAVEIASLFECGCGKGVDTMTP
jgi:hypothetical protein